MVKEMSFKELLIFCPECGIGEMTWSTFRLYENLVTLHEGWFCNTCKFCISMWEVEE